MYVLNYYFFNLFFYYFKKAYAPQENKERLKS